MPILNATATLSGAGSLNSTSVVTPSYVVSQAGIEAWVQDNSNYVISQLGIEAWLLQDNSNYVISQLGIEAWVQVHAGIFGAASFSGAGSFLSDSFIPKFISASFNGAGVFTSNALISGNPAFFNGVGLFKADSSILNNVINISATFNGAGILAAKATLSLAGSVSAYFDGMGKLIASAILIERVYGPLFNGIGLFLSDSQILREAELRVTKFNSYAVLQPLPFEVTKFNAYAVIQPKPEEVTKFQGYAVVQQIPTFNCPPIPVYPTLPGLEFNVHRKPRFASLLQNGFSGRETRGFQQMLPFWEFELSYSILRDETQNTPRYAPTQGWTELQQISRLFEFCAAQIGLFYFDDPADNSRLNQVIAIGDGTNGPYPIVRTWGQGPLGFNEPIGGINTMFSVAVGNTVLTPAQWQVEQNQIIFSSPITVGTFIGATFSFYYLCRFIEDQHDYEEFYKCLWSMKSVKFRSIIGPC